MKNNNPNNYIKDEEINLITILNFLIRSKKLIIIVTLISTVIATAYSISVKPSYVSTAKLVIGTYNYSLIQDIKDINAEVDFLFTKNEGDNYQLNFSRNGKKYITLKLTSNSNEYSNNSLKEIVDHIIATSLVEIEKKQNLDLIELNNINNQITTMEHELKRITNLQNVPNTDSRKDVFISELKFQIDELKVDKTIIVSRMTKFEYNKLRNKIKTNQVTLNKGLFIVLGLIGGFILSIFIVFFVKALKELE